MTLGTCGLDRKAQVTSSPPSICGAASQNWRIKCVAQHFWHGSAGLKNLQYQERHSALAPAWNRKTKMNQSFRHSERSLNACGFAGKIAANCAYFLIIHFARGEGVDGSIKVRPCSTVCRVLTKLLANIYVKVSREKAYCTVIIFNSEERYAKVTL